MQLLAAFATVIALSASANAINCHLPPELPSCQVCSRCRQPFQPDAIELKATSKNGTSRFFTDGDGKTAHRFAAFIAQGGKTQVQFKVTPDAPDKYRFFTIGLAYPGRRLKLDEVEEIDIILDGNMKGQGTACQYELDYTFDKIDDSVKVTELDPVPADRCY